MTRKPATRAPTARNTRLREAMAALLEHGSARKASKATGIPYRTIGTWAASAVGKAALEDLKATVGDDRAKRIWEVADLALKKLKAALVKDKIAPGQLAVTYGILCDKAARLEPKKVDEQGDMEIVVRFGGVRVREDGSPRMIEGQVVDPSPGA